VEDVIRRLGPPAGPQSDSVAAPTPATPHEANGNGNGACGCHGGGRHFGIFEDPREACAAAQEAFLQLSQKGIAGRRTVIDIVKKMATANAESWGRQELEETKIGRLDHKI